MIVPSSYILVKEERIFQQSLNLQFVIIYSHAEMRAVGDLEKTVFGTKL
jgi:hypothetical protein